MPHKSQCPCTARQHNTSKKSGAANWSLTSERWPSTSGGVELTFSPQSLQSRIIKNQLSSKVSQIYEGSPLSQLKSLNENAGAIPFWPLFRYFPATLECGYISQIFCISASTKYQDNWKMSKTFPIFCLYFPPNCLKETQQLLDISRYCRSPRKNFDVWRNYCVAVHGSHNATKSGLCCICLSVCQSFDGTLQPKDQNSTKLTDSIRMDSTSKHCHIVSNSNMSSTRKK